MEKYASKDFNAEQDFLNFCNIIIHILCNMKNYYAKFMLFICVNMCIDKVLIPYKRMYKSTSCIRQESILSQIWLKSHKPLYKSR